VAFDGRGSQQIAGAISAYSWSFGDGTSATGAQQNRRRELVPRAQPEQLRHVGTRKGRLMVDPDDPETHAALMTPSATTLGRVHWHLLRAIGQFEAFTD
jgi:hypothetical protein